MYLKSPHPKPHPTQLKVPTFSASASGLPTFLDKAMKTGSSNDSIINIVLSTSNRPAFPYLISFYTFNLDSILHSPQPIIKIPNI